MAEYVQWRAAATEAVERWEWYSWPGIDLRPLHFERESRTAGERLEGRPAPRQRVVRAGFDAAGRVRVLEEHDGRRESETFLRHGDGVVETARFDAGGRAVELHEYRFVAGLMVSARMATPRGTGWERFRYTDGRISGIDIEHDGRSRAGFDVEHDADGLVRIVETAHLLKPAVVRYERPPAGFDLGQACGIVEDAFVAAVPAAVARLAADGAVDRVALSYSQAEALEFLVHVATAVERAELAAAYDDDATWCAENFETCTGLDADVAGIRIVRQELALRGDAGTELGRRLLCAVAARLNRRDWSQLLPVTDDFVVYPVDLELADLHQNLADSVPPDLLARLRS